MFYDKTMCFHYPGNKDQFVLHKDLNWENICKRWVIGHLLGPCLQNSAASWKRIITNWEWEEKNKYDFVLLECSSTKNTDFFYDFRWPLLLWQRPEVKLFGCENPADNFRIWIDSLRFCPLQYYWQQYFFHQSLPALGQMKKLGLVGLWLGKISCLVIGGVYLVFQVFLFVVYFLKVFKLYLSKFDIANLRYCMLYSSSSDIEIWVSSSWQQYFSFSVIICISSKHLSVRKYSKGRNVW